MKKLILKFLKDEDAQALVEYALLLVILTVVSFAGFKILIEAWKAKFNSIRTLRAGLLGIGP